MKNMRLYSLLCIISLAYTTQIMCIEEKIHDSVLGEARNNNESRYINLSKDSSELYSILVEVTEIENDPESITYDLLKYIEEGFSIGLYDEVMEVLDHAKNVLKIYSDETQTNHALRLYNHLIQLIDDINNKDLTIDVKKSYSQENAQYSIKKGSKCKNKCSNSSILTCPPGENAIKICCKLDIFDKARFRKSVYIDNKLKVKDKAIFKYNAKFKEDVRIKGDLTVDGVTKFNGPIVGRITIVDSFIENLSATDVVVQNLSATDATINALSVTDLVIANCIGNLCVDNLSVNDQFVGNVLSANDIFAQDLFAINGTIDNLTVDSLSVTDCLGSLCVENLSVVDGSVSGTLSINDAIIDDLTVGTLSVTDCLGSLCVENLSVVDGSVSGTLSINDAIIDDLTVGTLSVTDCVGTLCVENLSVIDGSVSGTFSINDAIIDDLTVGTLSVTDCVGTLCVENLSVIDGSVSGTFSINDAIIDDLTVSDLVVVNCIDDLCVTNLSVGDASITGTLSVDDIFVEDLSATNGIIDNLTVGNLSVIDCISNLCVENLSVVDGSVSGTLSVSDLVVIDCMDDLCVNDLSAVDASISGTLSATDATIGTIDIGCDLIVGCNILMNNSTSPAIGNIMKAGNRFLHNFGTDNTFAGINSGNFTTTGAGNVGIGRSALFSNATGFYNVAVGFSALTGNTIGANNDAIGAYSLVNNTQGNDNAALGSYTLATNTTGSGNTALGFQAGYNLDTGNNNVFIGNNSALNVTEGFTNIIIGYTAGQSLTTGNDNIYIANPGVDTEDGIIRIGTPSTHLEAFIQGIFGTTVENTGIPVFVDANGQLGTVVSSQEFKRNIQPLDSIESEIIYDLDPVTFIYKSDESNTRQYGLIAEQVANVSSEMVVYDREGKPFTVRYHLLPVLLLNEIKRLNTVIQEQGASIELLKADTQKLNAAMRIIMEGLSTLS